MPTKTRDQIDQDVQQIFKGGGTEQDAEKYLRLLSYDPNNMDAPPPREATEKEVIEADLMLKSYAKAREVKEQAASIKKGVTGFLGRMIPTEEQREEITESATDPVQIAKALPFASIGMSPVALSYIEQDPGRIDPILEIAPAIVGTALGSRLGGFGARVGGSIGAASGTALSETRKLAMGESSGLRQSGANIAASAVGGFASPTPYAKVAGRAAGPLVSGLANTGLGMIEQAAFGGAAEILRERIDKGEWAHPSQVAAGAVFPAGITILALPTAIAGRRASLRADELASTVGSMRETGGYITPGQAMPTEFSRVEARMAEREPRSPEAQNYDKSMRAIRDSFESRKEGIRPATEVLGEISDLFNVPSTYRQQMETLSDKAIQSRQMLDQTEANLQAAFRAKNMDEVERLSELRQFMADESIANDFKEAVDHARDTLARELSSDADKLTPIQAHAEMAKATSRAKEGLLAYFKGAFNDIPKDEVGWAAHPIVAVAQSKLADITAGMDDKLVKLVEGSLTQLQQEGGVTLRNLEDLETRLGDIYRMRPEMKSTSSFKAAREVLNKIRSEVVEQAPFVLGAEKGEQLIKLKQQYWKFKDLEDAPGVAVFFEDKPTGKPIAELLEDVRKNGSDSSYFNNAIEFIRYNSALSPEVGQMYAEQFKKGLRGAIKFDARMPSEVMGGDLIDNDKLVRTLSEIEDAKPGSLKEMGITKPEFLEEFKALSQKYPEASRMTSDQWDMIMTSPAFRENAPDLIPVLEAALSDSQTRNLVTKAAMLEQVGDIPKASKAYEQALETAQKVGVDLKKVEALYEKAIQDPVLKALDFGVAGEQDIKKLVNLIAYTPGYDKEFTKKVASKIGEKNPEMLNQVRLHLEATLFENAAEAQAQSFSKAVSEVDVNELAKLTRKARDTAMKETWDRIEPFFTPEQAKGIQDLADEAYDKMLYQRLSGLGAPEVAKVLAQVGEKGAYVRAFSNAIENQRYKWAAFNLQHGSGLFDYSHRLRATEAAGLASEAAVMAGGAVSRDMQEERGNKKKAGPSVDRLREATRINLSEETPSQ